eukprot:gene19860-biopygen6355
MSRGGCLRPESSWNRSCGSRAKDPQLRFQLDFVREHMSSSETVHCYGAIDEISFARWEEQWDPLTGLWEPTGVRPGRDTAGVAGRTKVSEAQ